MKNILHGFVNEPLAVSGGESLKIEKCLQGEALLNERLK
jgi:hypothetical protein